METESPQPPRAPRGRPRAFCCEAAIDKAMRVFWAKGYEGASLDDLTQAMGINRPSLYAAFGNKEALFKKVLDHYFSGPASHLAMALIEPTIHGMVEKVLMGSIDLSTAPENPGGCLATFATSSCGDEGLAIRKDMLERREQWFKLVQNRFALAITNGELPPNPDAPTLARYLIAIMQGISMQASSGTTRQELIQVAQIALQTWPKPEHPLTSTPPHPAEQAQDHTGR